GEFLFKGIHLERTGKIGAQCHHFGTLAAEFEQAGAEAAAGILLVEYGVVGHGWEGSGGPLIEAVKLVRVEVWACLRLRIAWGFARRSLVKAGSGFSLQVRGRQMHGLWAFRCNPSRGIPSRE